MANKRANGEGTLFQREDGIWISQIMIGYKPDGKRDIRTFTGKTRKEAIKKREEFQRKRAAGLLVAEDTRFDEFGAAWLEHHKDNVSPTTHEHYRYTLQILTDYFGRRKLVDIKAMDIEQFLKKLRNDGRSDSAIAHCRGMLFQIFNKAAANDLVMKNPVAFADKMRKRPKKRKEAFTADEVRAMLRDLPENQIGWSIRLLLCTGMRGQELLALEPRHIAKDGSTITIEQALVRIKGSVDIGTPKSQDSYRTIPVPENVRYCAKLLRDTPNRFIWESPKNPGIPCNPSYFSKLFKAAVGSVKGVRVLTPHCCRHTYVSQMQALGVSVETIQSIVGHADMDMTRHYLHVQENVRKEAVDRFSEAFSKTGRGTFGNVLDYKKSS